MPFRPVHIVLLSVLGPWFLTDPAGAADLTILRVNVFPTAKNLPFFVGLPRGIFEKHGLKIELQFTPSSAKQRAGLAEGAFEIAHAAVDNAVAMVDVAGKDVVIVMGGDSGMNEFIVQPYVKTIADIRGKTLLVDAPDTAYALLAKKLLANPAFGFTLDAKFDMEGFRNTLAVRAEIQGQKTGNPSPPDRYLDLSYYQRALGR